MINDEILFSENSLSILYYLSFSLFLSYTHAHTHIRHLKYFLFDRYFASIIFDEVRSNASIRYAIANE